MVGPITASANPLAIRGVGPFGVGIKCGFGFGGVVASLYAVKAVAKPRATAIPAQRTVKLSFVAGAGLIMA